MQYYYISRPNLYLKHCGYFKCIAENDLGTCLMCNQVCHVQLYTQVCKYSMQIRYLEMILHYLHCLPMLHAIAYRFPSMPQVEFQSQCASICCMELCGECMLDLCIVAIHNTKLVVIAMHTLPCYYTYLHNCLHAIYCLNLLKIHSSPCPGFAYVGWY